MPKFWSKWNGQIFYAPEGAGAGAAGAAATEGQSSGDGKNAGRADAASGEPAWLAPRLERAMRKAREDLLAEIGMAPDEAPALKEVLAKHRETESEAAKLKRENERLVKESQVSQTQAAEHRRQLLERQVRDEVLSAISAESAAGRQVWNPEMMVALLTGQPLPSRVSFDTETGEPYVLENGKAARGKDVRTFVKTFLDGAEFLLKPVNPDGGAGSRVGGTSGGASKELDLSTATSEQKRAFVKAEAAKLKG